MQVVAYGAAGKDSALCPVRFERADVRDREVAIAITHCGVCHADMHQCRDDWENTHYPCVPGHEIVGRVTAVGGGVTRFAVGDTVGVGALVNSCQDCPECARGEEQNCSGPRGCTLTYNGPRLPDGTNTYGGYSDAIVVREEFVLRVPQAFDPAEAAPLLCAGVKIYNPMKHFGLKRGQRLAVAGSGGLGRLAIRIGKALGAHVSALTTAPEPEDDLRAIGADEVICMRDAQRLENAAMSVDLMIDTLPHTHDIAPYLDLLKPNTTLAMVGNMMDIHSRSPAPMVFHRIALSGSLIGGIAETQEVLDFCARHDIRPEVERIAIADINDAFARMRQEDLRYRQVIDMDSLRVDRGRLLRDATEIETPDRGAVVNG